MICPEASGITPNESIVDTVSSDILDLELLFRKITALSVKLLIILTTLQPEIDFRPGASIYAEITIISRQLLSESVMIYSPFSFALSKDVQVILN